MENIKFLETLKNSIVYKQISDTSAQVVTQAKMPNGKYIAFMLDKAEEGWILSDKKQTLKYMNEIYELKAPDVVSCIENVIKIYKFNLKGGEIVCSFTDEKQFVNKIFDFVMCIAQLVNMFAFFDDPNK